MYFIEAPLYESRNAYNFCSKRYEESKLRGNSLVKNDNGTLSLLSLDGYGLLIPKEITETCCNIFSELSISEGGRGFSWDTSKQKCMWSNFVDATSASTITITTPCPDIPIKITLNPRGNDGTIFYYQNDETCSLMIDFDYLFKIECSFLQDLITKNPNVVGIKTLSIEIDSQEAILQNLQSQKMLKDKELSGTPYSIHCDKFPSQVQPSSNYVLGGPSRATTLTDSFSQTGFVVPKTGITKNSSWSSSTSRILDPNFDIVTLATEPRTFCLIKESDLKSWSNVLGVDRYNRFLAGDPTSYTCHDVIVWAEITQTAYVLRYPTCRTAFGARTRILNEIAVLESEISKVKLNIEKLNAESAILTTESETIIGLCETPVGVFETLSVSMLLDVVESDGSLNNVYSENIFPAITTGELYNYLLEKDNSGFYVCGEPLTSEIWADGCAPLHLISGELTNPTLKTPANCKQVKDYIIDELFIEAKSVNDTLTKAEFEATLPAKGFASNWLHYNKLLDYVEDADIIKKIANKKIKISLIINNSCGDFKVLIDQISLDKICTDVDTEIIQIDKSPGFKLERVIDNKKSWVDSSDVTNRGFEVYNVPSTEAIRITDYNVGDDRLIINTKEIDLDIDLAKAVETDVWCYMVDNPCIFTGITTNNPCLSCNTNSVDYSQLFTTDISTVKTIDAFENFMLSEFIDAKNRKILPSYPTLKAMYERYLTSEIYCSSASSKYTYYSMEEFAKLMGDYWVDIIEQVVPATTIWGSVKIYTNTVFDEQKFRYKSYSSLLEVDSFSGVKVSNPINGSSGVCHNIEVIQTSIPVFSSHTKTVNITNGVCIRQMSYGSEFIGRVRDDNEIGSTIIEG